MDMMKNVKKYAKKVGSYLIMEFKASPIIMTGTLYGFSFLTRDPSLGSYVFMMGIILLSIFCHEILKTLIDRK